ncbi:hypothetical protein BMF94_2535 [Rhodotorula taiwanensis]|uniref:Uncharacterized protein n=1 Tax=Rhodotorula taiwanensis TaxID=741276 RepID=A0A2S5BC76_9BASI|nr:hypothetical protein BMF94_2535 [Rhodotorula taiwanensis]
MRCTYGPVSTFGAVAGSCIAPIANNFRRVATRGSIASWLRGRNAFRDVASCPRTFLQPCSYLPYIPSALKSSTLQEPPSMVVPVRRSTLFAFCLLAVLSVTSTFAADTLQLAADGLQQASHDAGAAMVKARALPPSEAYVHRSQPSRYEPFVSAAVLLRNAQLKAAAAAKALGVGRGSGVSNKQKSVSFRAATIKAAIMNSYTKRRPAEKLRKRASGGAIVGQDQRAVERARRNMAHGRPDHHAARAHIVPSEKESHGREGKDRFRPREISKQHRHEHPGKKGDKADKSDKSDKSHKDDKAGKAHSSHEMERMRKVPAKNGRR